MYRRLYCVKEVINCDIQGDCATALLKSGIEDFDQSGLCQTFMLSICPQILVLLINLPP